MNTDEKAKNDRASAGVAPGGRDPELEEIIDLIDEVPPDDNSSKLEQAQEIESETEVYDEDLIELTDVIEESFSETKIGETALEGGAEEIPEAVEKQGPEDEDLIELIDEIVPGVDLTQEDEEPIELVDEVVPGVDLTQDEEPIELVDEVVPEVDFTQEDEEPIELVDEVVPEVDSAQEEEEIVAPDDLAEGLGSGAEKTKSPELSEAEISTPEPNEDSLIDTTLPEKLSDEKLEEIITRIVKQTIEEKVERILLEAAESAIAGEIERLKQAL